MPPLCPMLSPDQLSVGPISSAGEGLTLVLPRTKYETIVLVTRSGDNVFAVLLAGRDRFVSFPAGNHGSYSGVLVSGVRIEVNPLTAIDVQYNSTPLGTIARKGIDLLIASSPANGMRFGTTFTQLMTGLSPLPNNQSAGFLGWQVVLGTGQEKQVVAAFTIEGPADN